MKQSAQRDHLLNDETTKGKFDENRYCHVICCVPVIDSVIWYLLDFIIQCAGETSFLDSLDFLLENDIVYVSDEHIVAKLLCTVQSA